MQLSKLTIESISSVVRVLTFKQGLNLILDKPTPTTTHSGNSVGKTTVLRLIDFCLGSEGGDIWQDSEFKTNVNQDVYDFLHGRGHVSIKLHVDDKLRGNHVLIRSFESQETGKPTLQIDNTPYKNVKAYRERVKDLLFGYSGEKPSLRQLVPKFVRSSSSLMSKTLKFLGDYASQSEYEAVHLFLFGFFNVQVLEERPRLSSAKKNFERDLQALNRLRKEGEIEQLLIHLRREIEVIGLSPQLRGEVPEIAERATSVTSTRSKAAAVAGTLSRYDSEIASLNLTIGELEGEYSDIDKQAIEAVYREAQNYIPKLHHEWTDLTDFIQSLRARKQRFLQSQIESLQKAADEAKRELIGLQAQENHQIGTLVRSTEFAKALELRADLQEKLKQLGSLEQDLRDIRELKEKISLVDKRLNETREQIEKEKSQLRDRVSVFNEYFSQLSKNLYGEQYLLHFDETDRGSLSFQLAAVGSNVGAGKKASQTAAFDLAYVKFLRKTGINFPTFVCHDGVEQIHGNQLAALLTEADKLDGQLILATLRDKLPPMPGKFVESNTVLELSQDDRLFRI
jgi:uncharacterized protein YydD (DUF2326 family)